ncbi:hypothetical protein M758_8G075500 [Ceratodon purpureus]|nr:hypothetical protein M758_8G075500 [Ceratodon purpureus]
MVERGGGSGLWRERELGVVATVWQLGFGGGEQEGAGGDGGISMTWCAGIARVPMSLGWASISQSCGTPCEGEGGKGDGAVPEQVREEETQPSGRMRRSARLC